MRGVVASAAASLGLVLLSGCAVSVDAPDTDAATTRACRSLVAALPGRVDDQSRREVDDADRGAAWGDPAIVLSCGVGVPEDFTRASACQNVDGVDWYAPERQLGDHPVDVTLTTVGRSPRVRVTVPADYWPPAAVMVDLAPALTSHTRSRHPCV